MLGKLKQMFGIGGVKIQCMPESPNLASSGGTLKGSVQLISKSDQHVSKITVKVIEKRTTGKGEEKKTQQFDLGMTDVGMDVPVKAGETKTLPFQVSYVIAKSGADRLADKGGALGMLGKVGKFAEHEKTVYEVHAHATVKGTAFGSSHTVEMNLSQP